MNKKETRSWLTTDRIQTLTDGVFAIAMTLLVLNIQLPEIPENDAIRQMPQALTNIWPHVFAYGLSFILLAIFWVVHHRQFQTIKRADEGLLWINIFCLMFIVLIPFTASLHGMYENVQITAVVLELNFMIVGLGFYINYWHATKNHRLVDKDLSRHEIDINLKKNLVVPAVSLLAIGVSFISPQYSTVTYTLIPVFMRKYMKG